jgi:hypothetical protein
LTPLSTRGAVVGRVAFDNVQRIANSSRKVFAACFGRIGVAQNICHLIEAILNVFQSVLYCGSNPSALGLFTIYLNPVFRPLTLNTLLPNERSWFRSLPCPRLDCTPARGKSIPAFLGLLGRSFDQVLNRLEDVLHLALLFGLPPLQLLQPVRELLVRDE